MDLYQAKLIAQDVIEKLAPLCERAEIAGSIRRRRPLVNDIDIVCIPSNQGLFAYRLQTLGTVKLGGQKIIRVKMNNIDLDIYIATPETWATLLLIRTGSAQHNIMLCSRAREMGMKLHADGTGLFNVAPDLDDTYREARIAGDTEASIFKALKMEYKNPWERECKEPLPRFR